MNINDKINRDLKQRALRLAELAATDGEDTETCVRDAQVKARLSDSAARVVAAAMRHKILPNWAMSNGISRERLAQMDQEFATDDPGTLGFAKDTHKDNMGSPHDAMSPSHDMDSENLLGGDHTMSADDSLSDPMSGGMDDDMSSNSMADGPMAVDPMKKSAPHKGLTDSSETNDSQMATIQLDVPVSKLDAVKKALESIVGNASEDPMDSSDSAGTHGGSFPKDDDGTDDSFDLDDMSGEDEADAGEDSGSDDPKLPGGKPGMDGSNPKKPPFGGKSKTHDTSMSGAMGGSADGPDSDDGEDEGIDPRTASRKVTQMTNAEKAQRTAARQTLITRLASDSETSEPRDIGLGADTSHGGKAFQYNDKLQYDSETDYPTMSMENSGGNSLKSQNPSFSKQMIPTMNPDNLGLKSAYEAGKKEGTADGSLEYTVDFDKLTNVPGTGEGREGAWDIPTQMGDEISRRTTTVAGRSAARIVECQGCTNPQGRTVESFDCLPEDGGCGVRVALCQSCVSDEYCPSCANRSAKKNEKIDLEDEDEDNRKASKMQDPKNEAKGDGPRLKIEQNGDGFSPKQKSEDKDEVKLRAKAENDMTIFKVKLATAYKVSTRLAMAGVITLEELDENVALWMRDGLSVESMKTQGKMMLRSAQGAAERVASSQDGRNTRTASFNSTPVLTGGSAPVSHAAQDIHEALRGMFTTAGPIDRD